SARLRANGRSLRRCYRAIAEVSRNEGAITPAAEWFVDNFHIVDEGLRDVRNDLPEGFYRQLPKLAEGPFAGRPRVFALAWAFVAHTDSHFDPATLRRFVSAFQRVQPLTIAWLNERLSAGETSADELVRGEYQNQGAMNVTVRNVITSMRLMSTFDWADFFESVSLVDETLRAGSDFQAMDFVTRDRYRHAIEDLSRGSGASELDIAREAVSRAQRSGTPPGDRRADPGFYLISKGRLLFEKEIGYRLSLGRRLVRSYVFTATASYLGTIAILTAR